MIIISDRAFDAISLIIIFKNPFKCIALFILFKTTLNEIHWRKKLNAQDKPGILENKKIYKSTLKIHDKPACDQSWLFWQRDNSNTDLKDPSFSFKVVVNKGDTLVHAGNADLILELLKTFKGQVQMYVLRTESAEKKVQLQMISDDIWAKGIRNGEVMMFDFFGPTPSKEFLRELAVRVNKYSAMDKIDE